MKRGISPSNIISSLEKSTHTCRRGLLINPQVGVAIIVVLMLFGSVSHSFGQVGTTYTAKASGNWNDLNTWAKSGTTTPYTTPQAGSTVVIPAGYTVTVNSSQSCASLTLESDADNKDTDRRLSSLEVSGVGVSLFITENVAMNGLSIKNGGGS
ncbi:MAG: hypothetical protein LPK14_09255, partial [Hymenobacteraceae bacterium]|nr:hypothetical protein [Hymenobacteraceae bacterium]